jgi:hypothetical protein
MERTDTVLLCLCIAAEGDISQLPSVLNGTNRYSTAVFVYSSRRRYFTNTLFLMKRTDTVLLCLCIAAEEYISQLPSVLNGTNRYSTAVFVYSSRR